MEDSVKLNKLPTELVNQIAAGEVVERPASIVKELVDNSIDAGASKIGIRIVNGGMDLVEISDNGIGIPQENLFSIFEAHTTSKISSLEDLNNLLTMGFRGEALSTIVSVSKVKLVSKYKDSDTGNEISFKDFSNHQIKKAAREEGTVITVEKIFENVPARRKFLKSAQTEYRKILDILFPYFLIYPNISFVVNKDGKEVYNLPAISDSKAGTISKERLSNLLKDSFLERMFKVFYNGNGIRISGFSAHPSDHQKKSGNQYIFVNKRPIWDNGIARAVYQGYDRYIPHGEKVPFFLNIDINPDLVDVNVHPRKEEVRFLNPFRVYSAVEEAIKKSISSVTSYKAEAPRDVFQPVTQNKEYKSRDISFNPPNSSSVRDSMLFTKELLTQEGGYTQKMFDTQKEEPSSVQEEFSSSEPRNIYQIFNKYILLEFEDNTLWIVDQHAAAERITFEKITRGKDKTDIQKMLVPIQVEMSDSELELVKEIKDIFDEIGFEISIEKNRLNISAVPLEFVKSDYKVMFDEIFALSDNAEDIKKEVERLKQDILATIACHGSVRSGQYLHKEEMLDLYRKLKECENAYSCPHGRPAVWKLTLSEIDKNFERTY